MLVVAPAPNAQPLGRVPWALHRELWSWTHTGVIRKREGKTVPRPTTLKEKIQLGRRTPLCPGWPEENLFRYLPPPPPPLKPSSPPNFTLWVSGSRGQRNPWFGHEDSKRCEKSVSGERGGGLYRSKCRAVPLKIALTMPGAAIAPE